MYHRKLYIEGWETVNQSWTFVQSNARERWERWTDSIASSIKSFIGYKSNGKCAEGHFRFHFRSAQFDRKGNRSHRHLGNDVDITRDRTSVHVIVRYSSYPKTWLQSNISPNPIEYLFKLRIETPTIYLHVSNLHMLVHMRISFSCRFDCVSTQTGTLWSYRRRRTVMDAMWTW